MNDSSLASISSILASLSVGPMGQTRGQSGSGGSAANNDHSEEQPSSKEPSESFSDIPLTFQHDKGTVEQKATSLQSFADFIVVHNLSTQMHVVPRYHGPKLIKLASVLADSSN